VEGLRYQEEPVHLHHHDERPHESTFGDVVLSLVLALSVPGLVLATLLATLSAAAGNAHWDDYLPVIAMLLIVDVAAWYARERARRAA
jgi:hypothetical protein